MTKIVYPLQQSLFVIISIIIVAGITFSTLMISQNTSQKYLQSQVYNSRNPARDTELSKASLAIVARLDTIIEKVGAKANTYSSTTDRNAFIDRYLLRISNLEDDITRDPYYIDTYSYLFTYLYPRVYELRGTVQTTTTNTNTTNSSTLTKTEVTNMVQGILAQYPGDVTTAIKSITKKILEIEKNTPNTELRTMVGTTLGATLQQVNDTIKQVQDGTFGVSTSNTASTVSTSTPTTVTSSYGPSTCWTVAQLQMNNNSNGSKKLVGI